MSDLHIRQAPPDELMGGLDGSEAAKFNGVVRVSVYDSNRPRIISRHKIDMGSHAVFTVNK
jgi:hypothetical protein